MMTQFGKLLGNFGGYRHKTIFIGASTMQGLRLKNNIDKFCAAEKAMEPR